MWRRKSSRSANAIPEANRILPERLEHLRASLRAAGGAAEAEALDAAEAGGATGTEIILRVHSAMRDLARSRSPAALACRTEIDEVRRIAERAAGHALRG